MLPFVIGSLFGFFFGSSISERAPREKLILAGFLCGGLFGVVVLIAGVPGWVGLTFGASVFGASTLAVFLPETNFAKAFVKKALG